MFSNNGSFPFQDNKFFESVFSNFSSDVISKYFQDFDQSMKNFSFQNVFNPSNNQNSTNFSNGEFSWPPKNIELMLENFISMHNSNSSNSVPCPVSSSDLLNTSPEDSHVWAGNVCSFMEWLCLSFVQNLLSGSFLQNSIDEKELSEILNKRSGFSKEMYKELLAKHKEIFANPNNQQANKQDFEKNSQILQELFIRIIRESYNFAQDIFNVVIVSMGSLNNSVVKSNNT